MRFLHVNGIVLHHRIDGPDDAPALVFSNSLGADLRIWDAAVERLRKDFRIVRYDKRGHGLSQATPAPYRLQDHAHDLAGLLKALEVEQAIVCGLSVGGMIAQVLAAEHPDRVRALVLSDTAHKIGAAQLWDSRIHAVEHRGIEAIADGIMERWFSADFRNANPYEFQGWRNMLTRTPVDGYIGTCAAIRDADLTALAERIAVPTLCVGGSEDGATPPELVRSLSRLIEHAHFRIVDGAGHLPCIEKPAQFVDEMQRFFQEEELVE